MQNKLKNNILTHIEALEKMVSISEQIHQASLRNDVDAVVNLTENRERLLNIIGSYQQKVEQTVNSLPVENIAAEKDNIKSWQKTVNALTDKIVSIDLNINSELEKMKESTTKEIASVYKSKQSFRGYNLNDLKK